MRLGIDAREIQEGVYTGIGRALANFLEYFSALNDGNTCVLFSSKAVPIDFGKRVKNVVRPENSTFFWDQWHLPQALKQERIDVFYSPYYKLPLLKPCPTVNAMLDLMYVSFEPYYNRLSLFARFYYAVFGRTYAYRADKILTCSEHSQKDIQRIYGVKEDKIKLLPLSISPIYKPEPGRSSVKGRYVLYVGNFKLHKNIESILEAFALVAHTFPDLKLVLAGPKEHAYEMLVDIVQKHGLQERVIFLGKIMEADKPQWLYSDAEVFLMPSLYEGFGLPVLEAMACGVPVIASNAASLPEIVKDAGIMVAPEDIKAMADAVQRILTDEAFKKEMVARGVQRAKEYGSAKVSAELYGFLKSVAKR